MKTLIVVAALAFGSTAVAQGSPGNKGCTPLGAWITMPNTSSAWMATMTGNASGGTYVVDVPSWPDLPPGIGATTIRGVWQRRGGNTFDATEFAWTVDASGTVQATLRISGSFTVNDDCDSMTIDLAGEVLSTDQNPVTAGPGAWFPMPQMTGYRMKVMPPPVPPQ